MTVIDIGPATQLKVFVIDGNVEVEDLPAAGWALDLRSRHPSTNFRCRPLRHQQDAGSGGGVARAAGRP